MFDKSAIEKLQEAQQIVAAEKVINSQMLEGHNQVAALPESFRLVDLEKYQPCRYRLRGSMSTESISNFAQYAALHNAQGANCFINAEQMSAQLIFNMGTKESAGHCDHTANVKLEKTAAYISLLNITDKKLSQKEVAEFIEDWRDFITCFGEEDEDGNRPSIKLPRALHTIRSITIEAKAINSSEDRTFGATKSSMESIDVSKENLPPSILVFSCQPYVDLAVRDFTLRLGVITTGQPALTLRIARKEQHNEEMAEEFKQAIGLSLQNLNPSIPTIIGTFKP